MAEMWDDTALIDAFQNALIDYKDKQKKKKKNTEEPDSNEEHSVLEEPKATEGGDEENEVKSTQNVPEVDTQQEQEGSYPWPGFDPYNSWYQPQQQEQQHQCYPYPYPYPSPFPWGGYMYPLAFHYPPQGAFQPKCTCNASSTTSPSSASTAPSFEALKAAVLSALSQLPAEKRATMEQSGLPNELLLAWFNAGFRTASYLQEQRR